jgi:Txe/YoeB family toxin of Txe-Axe toxin-antitoxin module
VLRGARQTPSKRGPELNYWNTTQQKKSEKTKERVGEVKKRPVELKGKFSELQ